MPPAARSKHPRRSCVAPVKLPFVAEQLALDQVLGNRAAVEGKEGFPPTLAELVDRLRDEFLARAALTADENRGVGRSDLDHQVVDLLHRGRDADQPSEPAELAQLASQGADVVRERSQATDVSEHGLQTPVVQGLREVVEGAEPQGVDRGVDGRHARNQDHVRTGRFPEFPEQFDPVSVGQHQIHQHEVGLAIAEMLSSFLEGAYARDAEALLRDNLLHALKEIGIVVNQERTGIRSPRNR